MKTYFIVLLIQFCFAVSKDPYFVTGMNQSSSQINNYVGTLITFDTYKLTYIPAFMN